MDSFLLSIGFTKSDADTNIYIGREGTQFIILAIYVDDTLLITNDSHRVFRKTKQALCSQFEMTDIGRVVDTTIHGLQIIYNQKARNLKIFQTRYIQSLLIKFKIESCNPASTPMELGLKMTKDDSPQTDQEIAHMKNISYKSLVGSLMHASVSTRPDISYSTNFVAQYLFNPGQKHQSSAKRILRYLKGTSNVGLLYKSSNIDFILKGYSDAHWAGRVDTIRSTSGYCFLLGKCVISWTSRRQRSVALSSIESEYMAISRASTNAV